VTHSYTLCIPQRYEPAVPQRPPQPAKVIIPGKILSHAALTYKIRQPGWLTSTKATQSSTQSAARLSCAHTHTHALSAVRCSRCAVRHAQTYLENELLPHLRALCTDCQLCASDQLTAAPGYKNTPPFLHNFTTQTHTHRTPKRTCV